MGGEVVVEEPPASDGTLEDVEEGRLGDGPCVPCEHAQCAGDPLGRSSEDQIKNDQCRGVIYASPISVLSFSSGTRDVQGTGMLSSPNKLIFIVGLARHQR